ncbi:hydroxylamine oxidation protein HaoB [Methylocaldum sp.]|uniref:hydroxylamine oxidation protein HaoB n=1 Tax=Methylocaldum sp. TaxID=1969727 RepID=UPI002D66CB3F|nr:hydroxylamine oxidation protein HaoB [Methylocaldum sp.]HYE34719.1 hydroxylamine oxidation protein HaoB [Methylocaldum sp.]
MSLLKEGIRQGSKPRAFLGIGLLLAGIGILFFGLPHFFSEDWRFEKIKEMKPGDAGFPTLEGQFQPENLAEYEIGREDKAIVSLHVVSYRDKSGALRRAIVYPPSGGASSPLPSIADGNQIRHDLWKSAAQAIRQHTDENAVFVSWWDDAQRIHFLAGRDTWAALPVAEAFPEPRSRSFWGEIAGGFAKDEQPLRQLAHWLAMDADRALAELSERLPKDKPVFLAVCLDDLARLLEMEALSGVSLPFEARFFPAEANIHAQISAVKRWAEEKGRGSYLVHPLPGGGIRAWRITSEEGEKTLLARLLPFVGSVANLPEQLQLVYQSEQGGYLSVFKWIVR